MKEEAEKEEKKKNQDVVRRATEKVKNL